MEQRGSAMQPSRKKRNVVIVLIYKSDSTFWRVSFPPPSPTARHWVSHVAPLYHFKVRWELFAAVHTSVLFFLLHADSSANLLVNHLTVCTCQLVALAKGYKELIIPKTCLLLHHAYKSYQTAGNTSWYKTLNYQIQIKLKASVIKQLSSQQLQSYYCFFIYIISSSSSSIVISISITIIIIILGSNTIRSIEAANRQ